MKRTHVVIAVAALFLVAFAPFADARVKGSTPGTLEVNAGYAKPTNDMTGNDESLGGGIAFGAGYWRSVSPLVSWGAEASYDNFGNLEYDNGDTPDNQITGSAFRVTPAMRVNFSSRPTGTSVFAQAGAGIYNVSAGVEDSILGDADDSETKFGINVGAGVSFPVSPGTRMNFNGLYHSVSTEGSSLNYFQFRVGYGFRM